MASIEHDTSHYDGPDGTYVDITKERTCQDLRFKKLCTPWVRSSAHIHLGPGPAERLAHGATAALEAIAGALAATGVGSVAAVWVALAGALVEIGYNALRNDDGSVDMVIDTVHVTAGSAGVPVHVDPVSCTTILHSL